jgi:hypothetical protein
MSFLQIKAYLHELQGDSHTRMEAVAGADNLYICINI